MRLCELAGGVCRGDEKKRASERKFFHQDWIVIAPDAREPKKKTHTKFK